MQNELNELITKYNEVSEQYTEASKLLDEIKIQKTAIKQQIIDTLKEQELDAAAADGKSVQIVKKRQYSLFDVEQFAALDDFYHTASLFSVNNQKLNGFCRDLEAINGGVLPDDIAQTLKCYEYEDLSVRKLR